jgi:hypothetical protein
VVIIQRIRTNFPAFFQSWANQRLIFTFEIFISLGAWLSFSPKAKTLRNEAIHQ